ncbi:tRNA pseudouridine synthase A [Isoalcanivorax pacificus W11-5]|uniref:tRNA pseudouridine synthase A n=1 Tax=Isoalcanivorax pacificus W11-5 TaxID=391936 RepID=A0A0B4XP53_9GAMM|nr:tRNA pseudouridine(38-40) synthase TruA [Isoalcanivorax pacificus]AJD48062.1 tRNA pseudouridine synthase A [Isoalcanivorax pacificus W11-5]
MARIALGVEYDGSRYHGWQTQQVGIRTVQTEVERALAKVANHPVSVSCAGRTDSGVHATGQVIHFDTDAERSERGWVYGANSALPADIAIRWAKPVSTEFHARFGAVARRYRYVIYNHRIRPALYNRQLTWNYRPLDIERMRQALPALRGTHDFTSYRGIHCQAKSPVKTLHHLELFQREQLIVLEAEANAFLMHMVRNIAGVLMAIGTGKAEPGWAGEVLAARDRRLGGVTAPPYGLYLVGVRYDPVFELPDEPLGPQWLPGELSAWR